MPMPPWRLEVVAKRSARAGPVSLPAPVDTRESEDEGAVFLPERRASHLEAIADLPFESLSVAHLDLLDETLATALVLGQRDAHGG